MRGIPVDPVDGQQYSGLFNGWPSVLEYDSTTGGFKLIVDAEIGEAIIISGSVDINAAILVGNQYAEDSPHTSGATGTFILNVRQDAPVSMVSTEGDYAPLITDVLGRLHVFTSGSFFEATLNQIVDTHVLNPQLTAQYAEDEMFVGGSTGTFVLAVRTDTMQSYAGADGDFSTLNTDILGRLYTFATGSYVHILSAPALVSATDSVWVTGTVVADTELPTAAAIPDAMAGPTAPVIGALGMGFDRSLNFWNRMTVMPDTYALRVEVTGTTITSSTLTNQLLGAQYAEDAVHASGATGSFVLGVRQDAPASMVNAEGDYSPFITDLVGRLHVFTSGSYSGLITGTEIGIGGQTKGIQRALVNITGSAGEFEIVAAVAAQRIKVTSLMLVTQVNTNMVLQSGWTGTAITGVISLPADGDGFFLNTPSTTDQFHFQTDPGENLVLDSTETFVAGGWIAYYTEA